MRIAASCVLVAAAVLVGCPDDSANIGSGTTADADVTFGVDTSNDQGTGLPDVVVTPDPGPPNGCAVGTPCDDGLFCTEDDACLADGSCAGVTRTCDDGVDCTNDHCDDTTNECLHFSVGCQCTSDAGCDDGNTCTVDVCDVAASTCSYTPVAGGSCDDKLHCTVNDVCADDGTCGGVAKDCDDGNSCTVDSCDTLSGACLTNDSACECTADAQCADDNPCTVDSCSPDDGTCGNIEQPEVACDDGNSCTVDSCDASGACQHDATGCECLVDSDCDDADDCTDDTCGTGDGICSHSLAPAGQTCDDGDGCSVGDVCSATGACGGPPMDCDDQLDCTADSCVAGACVNDPTGCECLVDGDCDDSDPCTSDACASETCTNTPTPGAACDDGDACTDGDVCDAASLCSGTASDCDDGVACSVDSCDSSAGCLHDTSACSCGSGGACETATLTATADTWLEGTGNKGSQSFLILGKTGSYAKKRSIVAFDTSSIPDTATVISAKLQVMYFTSTKPSGITETGIDRTIQVHQILVPWAEMQATQNDALSGTPWNTTYVGTDDVDAAAAYLDQMVWAHGDYGLKAFDVTAAAAAWVADAAANHGVLVWATNEDTAGRDQRFYSREYTGDTSLRPTLVVEYQL